MRMRRNQCNDVEHKVHGVLEPDLDDKMTSEDECQPSRHPSVHSPSRPEIEGSEASRAVDER